MKYINNFFFKILAVLTASFFLVSCSNIIYQIKEKDREGYILNKLGAYDPAIPNIPNYTTHRFRFLEKYDVSHDWPYAFKVCGYSTMTLPKEQRGGTWYSSYRRLGDIFEYKGETYQESSTVGYPKGTRTSRSKDRYVRTWKKVDGLDVERTHGYKPICWQPLGGTNHTLVVRLYKRSVEEWRKSLQNNLPDGVFSMQRVGQNNWLTQEFELKPTAINRISGTFKTWVVPIGDTGYTYTFQLGASKESLDHPRTHETMKKIFRHLIESVKIEPLSVDEAKAASGKVKKLIQGIEEHEARKSKR